MSDRKTCLDLFCGTKGFSSAFAESSDWDVVTVDIDPQFDPDICADVRDLRPSDFDASAIDVVVASPPCERLGVAQNMNNEHWESMGVPKSDEARDALALGGYTEVLIKSLTPEYWVIENPRGSMIKTVLGEEEGWVSYCQYDDRVRNRKPTYLWGDLPDTFEYRSCPRGVPDPDCHVDGSITDDRADRPMPRDPVEAARVPFGLSEAFLDAVESPERQSTLGEVVE